MRVSFVIPVYKVERWLERCVRSILDLPLPQDDYEIILVDDGSPDRSGEIADALAKKHGNIRVFHQSNQGQSVARNHGLEQAKGEYVWFVDSDDYVIGTHIPAFIDKAFELDCDILYAQMKIGDLNGRDLGTGVIQPFPANVPMTGAYALCHGLQLSSVCHNLYRRTFLMDNQLCFYPGITQQDVEFNTRALPLARTIAFFDESVYFYFQTGTSTTTGLTPEKFRRLLFDCAIVTRECRKTADRSADRQVKACLRRRANSITTGTLLSLLKNKSLAYSTISEFVDTISAYGLYPVKGSSNTLRSTIIGHLLSIRPIFLLASRMTRK